MRCLYFSETCVVAGRFIEVSLDFVEKRIQHAKQYQKSTMILNFMKSFNAHDVIDDLYCTGTGRRWKMKTPEFYK